jgi:hypothetical protein
VTSTTLDVCLCLLLVSASVLVVVGAPDPVERADGRARPTATALATGLTTVEYGRRPPRTASPQSGTDPARAEATYADHLGRAAVATTTLGAADATPDAGGYESRVRRAVASAVGGNRTQVVSVWRPYRNATLGGRVAVGVPPPPAATVHAAVVTVPTRFPAVRDRALAASDAGFGSVARVVARGVVAGLFPPRRTRDRLRGGGAASDRVLRRYRAVADALGVDLGDPEADVAAANAVLTAALARHVERRLRAAFDSPRAAARSVRTGTARVVVRTWSR